MMNAESLFPKYPAADIPDAAYNNTVRVLDAFDGTTAEYGILLQTQRTLLTERNFSGVEALVYRGDRLARDVQAYGQQINAIGRALSSHFYQGPLADALRQRIGASEEKARSTSDAAAELVTLCIEAQSAAAAELEHPSAANKLRVARRRYDTGQYRAILFDTVR